MKVKRLSFAAFLNDRLRKTIQELQDWHSAFDPSWWIIIRISNPQVDQQLIQQPQSSGVAEPLSQLKRLRDAVSSEAEATDFRQSVFVNSTVLCGERKLLPYSSLLSAQGSETKSGKLVDQMRPGKLGAPLTSIKDVRDLARVLSRVEPFTFARMWLPKCLLISHESNKSFPPDLVLINSSSMSRKFLCKTVENVLKIHI